MAQKTPKEETERGRALRAWTPFGELEPGPGSFGGPFSSRLPRLLDELFREWPLAAAGRGGAFVPAVDVSDDEKQYVVSVEIPGARKEDVHVELEEGVLTIRGEKKSEREQTQEKRRYVERSYGSFSRSFTLPRDADAEHLDATFRDGVLTVTIPKTEESKPRTIAVQ